MDNLRAAIKNLFCFIAPSDILNEKVIYNHIDEELFQKLGNSYMKQYSDDEVQNMYSFLENEFRWQNYKYVENIMRCEEEKNLNVFQILIAFCHAVLAEENGIPVCQYATSFSILNLNTSSSKLLIPDGHLSSFIRSIAALYCFKYVYDLDIRLPPRYGTLTLPHQGGFLRSQYEIAALKLFQDLFTDLRHTKHSRVT